MPDKIDRLADVLRHDVIRVMIAIGTGKNDNTKLHDVYLHSIIFDHGICENVFCNGLDRLTSFRFGRRRVESDLKIFTLPNIADILVAEKLDRMMDRFALRVKHARF